MVAVFTVHYRYGTPDAVGYPDALGLFLEDVLNERYI